MKPFLEHIKTSKDSSWVLFDRRLPAIPFEWHYNSEYELTLTLNSRGQRFIGDNISRYDDGDLVLIGPKIPHTWCSSEDVCKEREHQALVLWFSDAFVKGMIDPHVELRPIRRLLERSSRALTFSEPVREKAREIICAMVGQGAGPRLTGLLNVLLLLAEDAGSAPLASEANQSESFAEATEERIGKVISHLHEHYRDEMVVEKLVKVGALSRSSLHRLFKRQTRMTMGMYVAHLRVGHACALLLNSEKPIAVIADEVGYGNLANFNRQFKGLKGQTPREFRRAFQRVLPDGPPARRAVTS
ncbi:AraC family transcriptional regulator [Tunturiibacter gelidiferens]|uniref:AraC family transcriptional regulator n=1 Tax=Tunturiibacter gelidiferens TaxID=3069689 RepID=A0AAU7Z1Y8_9BACT